MRTHKELGRQLSAAAEGNRCLHPTDGAVHRALLRRKRTGDVVSPMPGLFIGSEVWESLNPIMQLTYVVRGLAQWHPDRVFTGLAAACILGLWMDYLSAQRTLKNRTVDIVCDARRNHNDSRHVHRLPAASAEFITVDGIRVTTIAQTAAHCACTMPFVEGMQVVCCALRNGADIVSIIAYATNIGIINDCAKNVFRFATPRVENGGGAKTFAVLIICGFVPPDLQVEFVDPQTGRVYRVDFRWVTRDGRQIVVELDGLVKYRDPQMLSGRTLGGVIDDERERTEALKRAGVDMVIRIRMEDLADLERLKWRLADAGVPLRQSSAHS